MPKPQQKHKREPNVLVPKHSEARLWQQRHASTRQREAQCNSERKAAEDGANAAKRDGAIA